jgi:hypothetical protein
VETRVKVENLIYVAAGYIEERGLSPLKDIHEKLGGFPVVSGEKWKEDSWKLENVLKLIRDGGYSTDYIIDFSVDTDLKNSSRALINVSPKNLKKLILSNFFKN